MRTAVDGSSLGLLAVYAYANTAAPRIIEIGTKGGEKAWQEQALNKDLLFT